MKRFACPSCGAEVGFKSAVSVYAVCPWCDSMLVRSDIDVKTIGKMAALPDDMSPLQIGTEGRLEGTHFGIIGRLKVGWRDGQWNEWHILLDSGERGWIGEAQGSLSVSFEKEGLDEADRAFIASHLGTPGSSAGLGAGFEITIEGKQLRAVDVKEATCLGSEGELPFSAPKGRRTVAIDFSGEEGDFATVEVEGEAFRLYAGRYIEWDDFGFSNLRPLEGW
jgi:hypothetical protein